MQFQAIFLTHRYAGKKERNIVILRKMHIALFSQTSPINCIKIDELQNPIEVELSYVETESERIPLLLRQLHVFTPLVAEIAKSVQKSSFVHRQNM